MHKRLFNFILLFTCVAVFSCAPPKEKPTAQQQQYFFDLAGYFKEHIAHLNTQHAGARKMVEINGEKEEQVLNHVDWEKEFEAFLSSDINKAAWKDKYAADTSYKKEGPIQTYTITYTALDSGLTTQSLQVSFYNPGAVLYNVYIHNRTGNFLYSSNQKLNYAKESNYSIEVTQKVIFAAPNRMVVKGDLLIEHDHEH